MSQIIIYAIFILLTILTVIIAYNIVSIIDFNAVIGVGIDRLSKEYNERKLKHEVKKYTRTSTIRMSITERIEIYFIEKSNIRRYIPFMNIYLLSLVCIVIFIVGFQAAYKVVYFVPSALVVGCLLSLLPLLILDLMGKHNSEKIRRMLAEFISILNRWCDVKEDIFYAFEMTVRSGISEPLQSYLKETVIQIKRGVDPMDALDILQAKVDNTHFRDFIVNIKQSIKSRGNIRRLLSNMEDQYYKLEEEYNRRKISTYRDRIIINFAMGFVLLLAYYFLKSNLKVRDFYLGSIEGKILMLCFSFLYSLGVFISFRITKFRY